MTKFNLLAMVLMCVAVGVHAADEGGTLKGSVKYDGEPPAPKVNAVPAGNQAACKCANVPDESLLVDKATHGLKWAVVRIMDVKAKDDPPKPNKPYQIDQKSCTFTPHVIVVPAESDIEFLNPDAIQHNIHTSPFDSDNPEENFVHGANEPKKTYKGKWLGSTDIMQLKCDMHGWMKGLIVVHDPRFCAVTPADGSFEITNVPPGKYKVVVYQESFGEKKLDVEIKAGAATDVGEIKYEPKK